MTDAIAAVRHFNRFFTRHVGALEPRFLGSALTLPEARVLFEIAARAPVTARDVGAATGLDPGYLSRIVKRFEARGWIARAAGSDARQRPITPTDAGRTAFVDLDQRQFAAVATTVASLSQGDQRQLAAALTTARALLGGGPRDWTLRDCRPGDMGAITARQAAIYAEMHGWVIGMEALLGEVTSQFLRHYRPDRERCWVADADGAMAGSVFLVAAAPEAGENVGQLRLLYTEPWARGLGIGSALIDAVIAFARDAGYRELILWTHSVLLPARRLYAAAGFTIRSTEIHHEFGKPEPGETWTLPLTA